MAFPILQVADCKAGHGTGTATYNANYPDNLALGDLILHMHANRGRRVLTFPSDGVWVCNTRPQGGTTGTGAQETLGWFKKKSLGSESGGTYQVTIQSGGEGWCWYSLRITGWEGTLGTTFDNTGSSGSVEHQFSEGNSSTPDPPNLDPNNWGTFDTLWLAHMAGRESLGALSGYGLSSYQATQSESDCIQARCGTTSAVGNLDPSAFTFPGGDDWVAGTIAIQGAPDPPIGDTRVRPTQPMNSGARW